MVLTTGLSQNKLVGIEKLDEKELRAMSKTLAERAECDE